MFLFLRSPCDRSWADKAVTAPLSGSEYDTPLHDSRDPASRGLGETGIRGCLFLQALGAIFPVSWSEGDFFKKRLRHVAFQKASRSSFKVYVLLEVNAGASQRPNLPSCGVRAHSIPQVFQSPTLCSVTAPLEPLPRPHVAGPSFVTGTAELSHGLTAVYRWASW